MNTAVTLSVLEKWHRDCRENTETEKLLDPRRLTMMPLPGSQVYPQPSVTLTFDPKVDRFIPLLHSPLVPTWHQNQFIRFQNIMFTSLATNARTGWVPDWAMRPTSLDRPLRSACTHPLVVPRTKTSYGDRGFSVHGPSVWNSLPNDLRSTDMSIETFRARLKVFLFGHWLQPICCFLRIWAIQMALLLLLLMCLQLPVWPDKSTINSPRIQLCHMGCQQVLIPSLLPRRELNNQHQVTTGYGVCRNIYKRALWVDFCTLQDCKPFPMPNQWCAALKKITLHHK